MTNSRRISGRSAADSSRVRAEPPDRPPPRRVRRLLWPTAATVVFLSALVIGVFPTRSLLAQQSAIDRAEHQLSMLEQGNAELESRVEQLNTPEAIERLAREQYNLVRPGEEPFAILPPPVPPVRLPDSWLFRPFQRYLDFRLGRG